MFDIAAVLQIFTIALLAVGTGLVFLFKEGMIAAVKTGAEEATKATLKDAHWSAELARELQKSRGVERQELRFKSYGALWKELRPLAIYDRTTIDQQSAGTLFRKLTDWYFSEHGGLFLTPQSRDFYFALQDLLRVTSTLPEHWTADRTRDLEGQPEATFRAALSARKATEAISVLDYFSRRDFADWQVKAVTLGTEWRRAVQQLGSAWNGLTEQQRFAIMQQVGSKLRSSLVIDLESRMP